jgi:hypothetical protein
MLGRQNTTQHGTKSIADPCTGSRQARDYCIMLKRQCQLSDHWLWLGAPSTHNKGKDLSNTISNNCWAGLQHLAPCSTRQQGHKVGACSAQTRSWGHRCVRATIFKPRAQTQDAFYLAAAADGVLMRIILSQKLSLNLKVNSRPQYQHVHLRDRDTRGST